MTNIIRLCDLCPGDEATVTEIYHRESAMMHRLCDLGFCKGACVKCVGVSPAGGMKAYFIKGAVLSVREWDSESIFVRKTKK